MQVYFRVQFCTCVQICTCANCAYKRGFGEIISLTAKYDIRAWGQSTLLFEFSSLSSQRRFHCPVYLLSLTDQRTRTDLLTRQCFLIGFIVSCVSHAFASVHCCLVVTCWERADLLALVGDVNCIFVTFPCGILCHVWYLNVSFPDL